MLLSLFCYVYVQFWVKFLILALDDSSPSESNLAVPNDESQQSVIGNIYKRLSLSLLCTGMSFCDHNLSAVRRE